MNTLNKKDQEILDRHFRDLVDIYSASDTTLMTLKSIISCLNELKCTKETIKNEIDALIQTIIDSKPRLFPLDNQIVTIKSRMESEKTFEKRNVCDIISSIQKMLNDEMKKLTSNLDSITMQGVNHIEDGDFIMVHSVDETVCRILPAAKRQGKNYKILVLKQDFVKTKQIINTMKKENIDYCVVPEYDLTHFIGKANKLFIGAQAVTSDYKCISDSGTASIVSTAHSYKTPTYLFANSLKITHRKADDQNIYYKEELLTDEDIEYTKISHSHDVVDLDWIDHLVLETGEITKDDLSKYLK